MDYSSYFEERLYAHVSQKKILHALAQVTEDTPICHTCYQYGNLGFMINAHQWVNCSACNPTEVTGDPRESKISRSRI